MDVYLKFSISLLSLVGLWPRSIKESIKIYFVQFLIFITVLPTQVDIFFQYIGDDVYIKNIVDLFISNLSLYGVIYVVQCFSVKKLFIKALAEDLKIFEKYAPIEFIKSTEKKVNFYTKLAILYTIAGNMCYALLPFFSYKKCTENKSHHMKKYGISCGVITMQYMLPFRYDYTPMMQLIMIEQFTICCLGSILIMSLTMVLIGILMHCNANLDHLNLMLLHYSKVNKKDVMKYVNLCIEYHTAIIEYTDRVNNAFSVMMLLHICGTSFILSVIGFGIILETDYSNSLRFAMHLSGWLFMLFLVCYYGQKLMDKSTEVGVAVYNTLWYEATPKVRESLCLILLRSQRPLVLKALGVNIMSLATFLGVLSTSYSYFTLFVNVKP